MGIIIPMTGLELNKKENWIDSSQIQETKPTHTLLYREIICIVVSNNLITPTD